MNRTKQFRHSALILGVLGALCACAFPYAPSPDRDDCLGNQCFTQQEDPSGLLRYAEHVSRMDESARRREYTRAEQAFAHEASTLNRLRLALLLTQPDTPFQCDSCARDLLKSYLQHDNDRAWRDFSALLLRSTEQRLALQQELDTERKQHQQMRQQLEKLKAIEKRLTERDRAATTKPEAVP